MEHDLLLWPTQSLNHILFFPTAFPRFSIVAGSRYGVTWCDTCHNITVTYICVVAERFNPSVEVSTPRRPRPIPLLHARIDAGFQLHAEEEPLRNAWEASAMISPTVATDDYCRARIITPRRNAQFARGKAAFHTRAIG